MVKLRWAGVVALGLLATQALAAQETPAPAVTTQQDKLSYAVGVQVARNLKQQGLELNADVFIRGLREALAGGTLRLTEEEMQTVLTAFQDELERKQADARKAAAEKNAKDGAAFLAANKAKPGVVTLPSGLQYKVLKTGEGRKPVASERVECHYRGALLNGTEFDSSSRRGEPAVFGVSAVMPGWTEALQLMPVGSKWQLFVPADLAYGARGFPPQIGPNATLVFEIELLAIK